MKKVKLIKTNGEESVIELPQLTIKKLHEIAGCDMFDTVNLRDGRVMMIDDLGHPNQKPVNEKATALYHSVCVPGTTWEIRGDVVICNDEDWK